MTLSTTLRRAATAAAVSLSLASVALAEKATDFGFLIVDILPVRDGISMDQVRDYFAAVEPIFARYDMVRSDETLEVVSVPRGIVRAQVINLWSTKNPKVAFDGIFSDPDYLQHVENRDKIFDLEKANVVVTRRNADVTPEVGGKHP